MTLIRHARLAKSFPAMKINFANTRMELWDFREIHAEPPHHFQRRVNDDFLLGSKWRSHNQSLPVVGRKHTRCTAASPRSRGLLDRRGCGRNVSRRPSRKRICPPYWCQLTV